MYRADGYRVRGNDAMYELVPYIMPYRYDASNSVTVDIDLDLMQDYIKKCRKKGINMSHMSMIIENSVSESFSQPVCNEQKNLCTQPLLRVLRNITAGQDKRYGKQAVLQPGRRYFHGKSESSGGYRAYTAAYIPKRAG